MNTEQEKPSGVQFRPFLFSGCLYFSLSSCPPLPNVITLSLWGGGYLLSTWIRGNRDEVASQSADCLMKSHLGPGCCGSVAWASACKLKGYWFDFQSGHMPGLQTRFPIGGCQEAASQCLSHIDVSLPVCLPTLYLLKKKSHLEDAPLPGTASSCVLSHL